MHPKFDRRSKLVKIERNTKKKIFSFISEMHPKFDRRSKLQKRIEKQKANAILGALTNSTSVFRHIYSYQKAPKFSRVGLSFFLSLQISQTKRGW